MIVDELGRIPMSPNLAAALQRASDYAAAQLHREVTLEHLLLALTQDADAGQVLEASHVDLSRLEADVSTHLGRIEERFQADEPLQMTVAGELKRILEASAAAAAKGRRREINGAIVLAAIVGDGRTVAAHMLRAQGLTFEEAIRVLRAPAPPPRPAAPPVAPDSPPLPAPATWAESVAQHSIPPPRPEPSHAPGARSGNPATEDILAGARERVQTRTHPPMTRAAEPERRDYEPAFEPMVPAAPARPAPPVMDEPEPEPDEELAAEPRYEPPAPEWQSAPPAPASVAVPPSPPPLPAQMEPHWAPPPMQAPSHSEPQFRPHPGPAMAPPPPRAPQLHPPYSPPPLPVSRPAPPPTPPAGAVVRPPYPPRPMTPGATPPAMPPVPPPMQAAPPPPSREQLSPPAYAPWPELPPEPPRPMAAETTGRPHTAPPARAEERRRASSPASVEAGQLAENVPRKMRVAVPVVVEARIAKASIKAIADGMSGSVHQHEVQVTKAMSVKLRAPDGGFWIETASPETQWIESIAGLMSDDFASWRWSVTPRSSGRKRLQLVVSARTVGADGLTAETALPDQIIDVRVGVNWAQTAQRWGGWVAAAILGGLIQRFGEGALADGLKSLIALVTG